jgi:hypothetical protein
VGISDDHLSFFLSFQPRERESSEALLYERLVDKIKSEMGGPQNKRSIVKVQDVQDADIFVRDVRRLAFLQTGLETARQPGVPTATGTAFTLWDRGREIEPGRRITGDDVMGAGGEFAPMTPVGAAAGKPDAVAKREHRIGRIFAHLLDAAKQGDVIVAAGGYNLTELGHAVAMFLSQHFSKVHNETELEAAAAILRVEVLAFLASYHGK